jgi:hypothetical protein
MHPRFYGTRPTLPKDVQADNSNDLLSGVIFRNAPAVSERDVAETDPHIAEPLSRWRAVKY